eukprot:TRINITY_DN66304_c0_g1_i1.p2 TRINITY_DN66304_c0_g1~~TRINITY_DN66304_c0_g1_i1.p2  ORF type:complete len:218 (-),score=144.47 TRINITY_DN66304_c0_g1_i1:56-709(-)
MENTDKPGLFAMCPVKSDRTVSPVLDSSRYFVLRVDDGRGNHAFIGVGFQSRDDAFEFKAALQDHKNQENAAERAEEFIKSLGPSQDFSIPEGGMIKVDLKGKTGDKSKKKHKKKKDKGGDPSRPQQLFALAPPPANPGKDKKKKKKKKKDKKAAGEEGGGNKTEDMFGMEGLSLQDNNGAAASASSNSNELEDVWGSFEDPASKPAASDPADDWAF